MRPSSGAVKVFKIEELKESQPAACGRQGVAWRRRAAAEAARRAQDSDESEAESEEEELPRAVPMASGKRQKVGSRQIQSRLYLRHI